MITLKQLIPALISLDVSDEKVQDAINALLQLQGELDNVEVKGRIKVDTLLGCMMAVDAIIGKDGEDVNG